MTDRKPFDAKQWLGHAGRNLGIIAGFLGAFLLGLSVSLCGETPAAHTGAHAEAAQVWTCSMHPQIRSDKPGKCPICGMDLIPLEGEAVEDDAPNRVSISNRARIQARIATAPVTAGVGSAMELRLLGKIDYDETRMRTVTAWVGGRIDRLLVATTGQRVRKGQAIAKLYSPEVYAAHSDLLVAVAHAARLENATSSAKRAAHAAVAAARQRLHLLGVPDTELDRMVEAKEPWREISIRSQFGGTVIERMVDEGNYVQPGSGLYKVADLSRLWVQLDAYESDLVHLKKGQIVQLSVEALPGRTFEGKVAFIDPVVNPRTRTTRVRVEVRNPEGALRPGMFAEANVEASEKRHAPLVIPDTAPLFTGRRSVVFVEVPDTERPTYEAREVTLGAKTGDVYPVLSGLSLGELVVVRGAFALDADLQIRGGASMMTMADDAQRALAGPIDGVPDTVRAAQAPVVMAYLKVQGALAGDDLAAAKTAAKEVIAAVPAATDAMPAELAAHWKPIAEQLVAHAEHVAGAGTLDHARMGFEALSTQVMILLRRFGNPIDEPLRVAYCPMAMGDRGASWVQRGQTVVNSYEGKEMLTCGELQDSVEPGTFLQRDVAAPAPAPAPAGGHQH